jgi:hypothetical protein
LVLTLVGAVAGVIASDLGRLELPGGPAFLPGAVGTAQRSGARALATFFTREILNPERERTWVRARSMAEALKAET